MRIRTAIFGVYVLACAIGYVVLLRFMLAEVRPRYVTSLVTNLEASARLLAAAIGDRVDAATVQSKLLDAHSGLRVRLVAGDGEVLLDTLEPADSADPEYAKNSGAGLTKRAATTLLDHGAASTNEVTGSASLKLADGRTATLSLSRPIRGVNAVIWAERKKLAAVALLIAAVMVAAGWWIATKLTDSLEKLTLHAHAVRDGRASKAPSSRAREIADLARAFEEMRDALAGRQHAERYTRALAHEVKAPLTAIRGAAELLQEEMAAEQRQKFLRNIQSESARIERIVERLLELTSLEARKNLQAPEAVLVTDLFSDLVETLTPAYAASQLTLTVAADPKLTVVGERFLLRQALLNLLQNALEFSAAGQHVHLRAVAEGVKVMFIVDDQGPGVPDYAVSRVFERFYSLPRPSSGRKSTGIGLALVHEVAVLHGGGADLKNKADGGCAASFWVRSHGAV